MLQKELINILKQIRIEKGFTQTEMAYKLGLSLRTYTRYENYEQDIKLYMLVKIFKILNIKLNCTITDDKVYNITCKM